MTRYSAGMMSVPFLFLETRKTALLLSEGLSLAEIKRRVTEENIYQMRSAYRAERYFNVIRRRLTALPDTACAELAQGDPRQAKQLLVLAIARTDLLFFEFLYEVFRHQLQMGARVLEDQEINSFFKHKAGQSDVVAAWKETTVEHLKQYYLRVLYEAGLLGSIKQPRALRPALFTGEVIEALRQAGLGVYLSCLTGDSYE